MNRNQTAQSVRTLHQSAIIANSAVASMARAAAKSNPERFLRCWTAEQNAKLARRGGK